MSSRRGKVRADELLAQQGHAETRSKARALIMAGEVRAGERRIDKPGQLLDPSTALTVHQAARFVSRGGVKLDHALGAFGVDVVGRIAADIGASTGGFTDALLQRGAARVYAIDVGYGQIDYRLRVDPRVVVMDRVNARYLEALSEPVDIVVVDVSFISLEHILPVAARLLGESGDVVALIKPQFEAGKDAVGRGGVVRDEGTRRAVVEGVIASADRHGLALAGVARSPITGPAGNVEFLAWFRRAGRPLEARRELDAIFEGQLA